MIDKIHVATLVAGLYAARLIPADIASDARTLDVWAVAINTGAPDANEHDLARAASELATSWRGFLQLPDVVETIKREARTRRAREILPAALALDPTSQTARDWLSVYYSHFKAGTTAAEARAIATDSTGLTRSLSDGQSRHASNRRVKGPRTNEHPRAATRVRVDEN